MVHIAQESIIAPEIPIPPALPNRRPGGTQICPPKARWPLSTEFAFKGAELSHCLMGAGSSEGAGQFQQTTDLREHTACGVLIQP